jgi:cell division protein FtsW (lipid II flippase)
MRARKWISIIALILFPIGLVVADSEMCDCPTHWAVVSVFGVIALLSGPKLYRWLGVAAIVVVLIFTYRVWQAQIHNSARVLEMRKAIDREQSQQNKPQ